MRTTINLDEQLLADAKAYAAQTGRTLSDVVEEALREVFAIAAEVKRRGRVRLPVLKGSRLQPGVDLDDSAALLELEEEGRWSSVTSMSSSTCSTPKPKTTRRTGTG